MRSTLCLAPVALALLACASQAGAQDPRDYYLYQRTTLPSALHVDFETASGTRDAGAFGRHGVEGLVRTGVTLSDRWTLESSVGVADDHDTDQHGVGWSAEARYGLSTDDEGWGLGLGAGYRRSYDGVSIPYLRLVGERSLARWNVAFNSVVEMPESDRQEHDNVDLIESIGTSYAVSSTLRAGVELAAEDVEGFFSHDEAEGGAKFILGPTLSWLVGDGQTVRAHVGWIYAATANAPTNPESPDYRGHRNGVLARIAFGYGR